MLPVPNRFERHPRLTLLLVVLAALLLLELALRGLAAWGVVGVEHHRVTQQAMYLDEINRDFGIWHYPDVTYAQSLSCAAPVYHTNAFGMRDRPRQERAGGSRVVVLGDSFVEGVGVDDAARFTNLLEQARGREFLNFASTAFGPIQEWLLYQTLASRFEHDELHLFIYPNNDFIEMDPAIRAKEYRPFLRPVGEGYEVYYTVPFNPNGRREDLPRSLLINNRIANHWYLYNLVRQAVRQVKRQHSDQGPPTGYVPYRDVDTHLWPHARYAYQRLSALAGERPLRMFVVPSRPDLAAAHRGERDFPVVRLLGQAAELGPQVRVYDLLPYFLRHAQQHGRQPDDYYIPCDGHWNELGHQVAAEAVAHYAWGVGQAERVGSAP